RRLYLAPPSVLLDVLREQDDADGHVLVVGHNPGLTEAANRLLPTLACDNLPTSAVVAIAVDTDRWAELGPTACRLLYFDYPKNIDRKSTRLNSSHVKISYDVFCLKQNDALVSVHY